MRCMMFMAGLSGCADRVKHRQDDVTDKDGREKPERWSGNEDHGVEAPDDSSAQAEATPGGASLKREGQSLEEEIRGGQAITAVRWNGDDQIVDQTGHDKHCEQGEKPAQAIVKRFIDESMSEIMKSAIPAAAPEFTHR